MEEGATEAPRQGSRSPLLPTETTDHMTPDPVVALFCSVVHN